MRILIVTAYFPPLNSIASIRPYSWAKWWSKRGHDVTVFTTTKQDSEANLKYDCSFCKIIERPVQIPFQRTREYVKTTEPLKNNKKQKVLLKQKILLHIKQLYLDFIHKTGVCYTCRYPDWHDKWIKKYIKQFNPKDFDIIVTTGGPYSVHRAGLFFKKKKWNGKWICDWRDLWTKNHLFPGLAIFRPLERFLERQFHNNADYITTVSDESTAIIQSMTKTPVTTIYNGFDVDDFIQFIQRPRKNNKRLTFSYLGTLYKKYQNPEVLFQSISELDKEGKLSPEDLLLQFAGANSDVYDLIEKYGLSQYYSYLGLLPRESALEVMYDSDAVIFLEYEKTDVKGVLTGKIFEYLYLSRLILGVGCTSNTSAGNLIEKCNAGICLDHDKEKIKNLILKMKKLKNEEGIEEACLKNLDIINLYSRKVQAERMLELVL